MNRHFTIRRPRELVEAGLAPEDRLADLQAVAARYAVAITPAMAEIIDAGDPHDPIARQFVPDAAELRQTDAEDADPIGDAAHAPVPGIVHRYPDRVLLKLVSVCPVYCRFCFRRETVGPGGPASLSDDALGRALGYVAERPGIWEVVVTGGDPLVLSARRIAALMARLSAIPHVRVVRFHSRVPVVAPERVDGDMVAALRAPGKATWIAVHANHPREIGPAAAAALARLVEAGIPLVGQTVLLRGVNDDPAVLSALMRAFVENRVKPYYLHQGDLAPGTSHLRTTIAEGRALMAALRGRVSGLCQPSYVLDIPGGYGKVPVGPVYLSETGAGAVVTDFEGRTHAYPPHAPAAPPDG